MTISASQQGVSLPILRLLVVCVPIGAITAALLAAAIGASAGVDAPGIVLAAACSAASLAGAALLSVGMLATFPPRPVASVAMLIVAASTFRLGCMVAIGLALYYALHPHAASLWLAIVGGWFAVSYAEFRTVAPVLNGAGPRPPMMTPQTPPQQNRIPAE